MLTNSNQDGNHVPAQNRLPPEPAAGKTSGTPRGSLFSAMMRPDWLGQMAASLCWIASVFCYGITAAGDWLQLAAAGSWCVANIAALTPARHS